MERILQNYNKHMIGLVVTQRTDAHGPSKTDECSRDIENGPWRSLLDGAISDPNNRSKAVDGVANSRGSHVNHVGLWCSDLSQMAMVGKL